ncbi:MutS protein-like protein 4 [Colletotrichum fructicola]|nr:MutS protein-like protein 4 [Colletotrichum fructicola]
MEDRRLAGARSVASFRTAQTRTPISRESSPYFSSQARDPNNKSTNSAYFTATPEASSSTDRRAGLVYTPSYDYYDDTSGTTGSRQPKPSSGQSYDSKSGQSYTSRPGTSYSSRTSRTPLPDSENHKIVCALSEARGVTPSVGMASINVATGEVILSQISDSRFFTRTIHELQIMEPHVVLIVSTACPPNPKSRLYSHIEENMPGIKIAPVDRRCWSELEGMHRVNTCAFREDAESIKVALEGSFYATCSFAAAVSFIEDHYAIRVFPNSLRVRFQSCEDTMMIDVSTILSLEILQNLRKPQSKDNLVGLLNQTKTPMGSRVLRSNLLQPSTLKEAYLDPRYEAVEELHKSVDMFVEVRKALSFPDVEKMLTRLVLVPPQPSTAATESSMDNVLKVKAFVDGLPDLYQAMRPAVSPLLTKIRDLFRPEMIAPLRTLIYETIHEDVTHTKKALDQRNQRAFAVKAGVNGLLDVARQAYKENTEDVHKHVDQVNGELDLDAKLQYDPKRGYSLRMREVNFEDRPIPDILVNRVVKRGNLECMTIRLKQLNQRISDSVAEIAMQCDKVIEDLIDNIRTQIAVLYRICESVALLDMLASFAHVSSTYDWVRPEVSDTLALKAARHPILDRELKEECVPNDFYADDNYRFQIITGCNMSGKTTYIKSIALLQIMAQIGCFVPAERATLPIVHSIFARVSTDDNIEANLSSFSKEMREMAFILNNVDDKSMVIIDELGRATSARDGLAIAIAMAEALIQSRAKVWFTTHFAQLAEVLNDRPGVLNLHLASHLSNTSRGDPRLTMTYKVESGKVEEIPYGILLAKAMDFPKRFLDVAEHVSQSIREDRLKKQQTSEARRLVRERKLVLSLHEQLKQARNSQMDDAALASYLKRLQVEFVERFEALRVAGSPDEDSEEVLDEEENETFEDDDVFDSVDVESLSTRSPAGTT